MSEINSDFYSKKHIRLGNISKAANVFAWIILVIDLLITVMQIPVVFLQINNQVFMGTYQDHLLSVFNSVLNPVGYFMQAIVYFLILKGISLGLNMIIETDLNYRERSLGAKHE